MKFLTDRKEIANEINIKETPVIVINVRECMKGYERCYEGDKVVVKGGRNNEYGIRCFVQMFGDDVNEGIFAPQLYKKICLMPDCIALTAGFGYHDVAEMAEWRKAQRITEGEEVIVMFDKGDECWLRKMKVGKVQNFVYPAAVLEDVD